ncbi:unnamed protein product [Alternaria alternata]
MPSPIPHTSTSHPEDPIPAEPKDIPQLSVQPSQSQPEQTSPKSSGESTLWTNSSDDSEAPMTPMTEPDQGVEEVVDKLQALPTSAVNFSEQSRPRRASTTLISDNPNDIRRILGEGETATKLISQCCGGGCCLLKTLAPDSSSPNFIPVVVPDNHAFRSLNLQLGPLALDSELTDTIPLPPVNMSFEPLPSKETKYVSEVHKMPPKYVQPHPPYEVYSAPLYHARELTKPGAEKRTIHFDIDVTDYPDEGGVDFKVGGAVGICPPNSQEMVDELFDLLCIPKFVRDKPVTLKTQTGRWPTIWGEDQARELVTTRRELLTWCADIQSHPPTKNLLRVLAEYADAPNEKKRISVVEAAAPHLLSVLTQLMPRFYSLSNDPHISSARPGLPGTRRLIEMAVTIHETPDWHAEGATHTGRAKASIPRSILDLRVPMFRGLMANPLSKQFGGEGPMVLIGAGVGMAPFRGFILNRLKNANCANKIWLIQGVRDSMLDELYSGELGDHEREIKKVVQSRKVKVGGSNEVKYVQDEVRVQADIVWFVINALDGRIFVCGSSKGMGEGVEESLIDVAMQKGRLSEAQAKEFWARKREDGQYIAETW